MREQELRQWLGPLPQGVNPARRGDLIAAAAAIAEHYPGPGQVEERENALAGTVAVLTGEATLEQVIRRWYTAAGDELEPAAFDVLVGALIATSSSEDDLVERTRLPRQMVTEALVAAAL